MLHYNMYLLKLLNLPYCKPNKCAEHTQQIAPVQASVILCNDMVPYQETCHAMVPNRVFFRCKKIDSGVYEDLPVAAIQHDADYTHVPVYEYPFLHEKLYAWGAARTRVVTRSAVARATGESDTSCCLFCLPY